MPSPVRARFWQQNQEAQVGLEHISAAPHCRTQHTRARRMRLAAFFLLWRARFTMACAFTHRTECLLTLTTQSQHRQQNTKNTTKLPSCRSVLPEPRHSHRKEASAVGVHHVDLFLKTLKPKPQTSNPKHQTPNSKPQTPNPKPQTPNPKSQTPNPKPHHRHVAEFIAARDGHEASAEDVFLTEGASGVCVQVCVHASNTSFTLHQPASLLSSRCLYAMNLMALWYVGPYFTTANPFILCFFIFYCSQP